MVQAGDDDDLLDAAEYHVAEDAEVLGHPDQAVGDAVGQQAAHRADDGEQQDGGDQHRAHGAEQQLDHVGDLFVKEDVQLGNDEAHHQRDDDAALKAHQLDVQPEQADAVGLDQALGRVVSVGQRAVQHDGAHHQAQDGLAAVPLAGGIADGQRQDAEDAVGRQADQPVDAVEGGVAFHHVPLIEHPCQARQQRRSQDAGHDVHKYVGQALDDRLQRVHLLGGLGLDFGHGGASCAGVLAEYLVDLVDQPSAEDDLELVAGHELTFDQVDVVNGLLVDLVVIFQHDAQPRCAVRAGHDVFFAADLLGDLPGYLKIPLLLVVVAHG